VATISLSAKRAADLTSSLLAFARKGRYQTTTVDVHSLLREMAMVLARSFDRDIRVTQALRAPRPTVTGDPTQIQNLLLNLALNARDAMPQGGELTLASAAVDLGEIFCKVDPCGVRPGPYLEVTVRDTGVGMSPDVQQRMFEPFFTTKERGTGMGLAAAYGILTSHHGTVRVESAPGQGTTVRIYLPLSESPAPAPCRPPVTAPKAPAAQAHVLVVDDEDDVRRVLGAMLRHLGHRVTLCDSGAAAVEEYREVWPDVDLVILDMTLPGMDGERTFGALRDVNPHVAVLIASGYSPNGQLQRLLDQGVTGFLQKPFRLEQLHQSVSLARSCVAVPGMA
jgi:CheY-like chemotaxis protein